MGLVIFVFGYFDVLLFALQSEALRPIMVSRTKGGFTLNIIDTPGLVEAGYVSYQALELIKGLVFECCGKFLL